MRKTDSMKDKTEAAAFEEAKERLVEYNKKHPQRQQGNLKGEELKAHNQRMAAFMLECRKNRNVWDTKAYADPDVLVTLVDKYLDTVAQLGMFPTVTGLALYLDVSVETINAIERLNDERTAIFKKFRTYISEYFNQNGLTSNSNPVFSIYYGKSVLGQTDNPQLNVNVNYSARASLEGAEIAAAIDATPDDFIEAEYQEIGE